jgi:hypothetical protein
MQNLTKTEHVLVVIDQTGPEPVVQVYSSVGVKVCIRELLVGDRLDSEEYLDATVPYPYRGMVFTKPKTEQALHRTTPAQESARRSSLETLRVIQGKPPGRSNGWQVLARMARKESRQ